MERFPYDSSEDVAETRRLADTSDAVETLPSPERGSVGHLMYDPDLPEQELEPVIEAFILTGRWITTCPVEGFLRPVLQVETGRTFVGVDAIVGYASSLEAVDD